MKRKLLRASIVALILLLVLAIPVLASYSATITVTESAGNSYTNLPIIDSMGISSMVTSGFISSTGLDTRVKYGNTGLPHMLADDKLLFVSDITANTSKQFTFSTDNTTLTSFPIIVGVGGYVTTADNATLEPGDNFELEFETYIADATYTVFDKQDALRADYNHTTDVLTITAGNYSSPDYTLTATSVDFGEHVIEISNSIANLYMYQPLFSTRPRSQAAGTTRYTTIQGNFNLTPSTDEGFAQEMIPCDGVISGLQTCSDLAPGAGQSYTYTLRVNGVDTALTASITGSNTTASDTTHTVSVSTGDLVSYKRVWSGGANPNGIVTASSLYQSTAPQTTIMMRPHSAINHAIETIGGGTTAEYADYWPTAGTIKDLYIWNSTETGEGASYTVTMYKNGVATDLTATILEDETTASDTTHTVSVSATDRTYFSITSTGTPVSDYPHISVVFNPATNGETALINYSNYNDPNYIAISSDASHNGGATFATHYQLNPTDGVIRDLYLYEGHVTSTGSITLYQDNDATPTSLVATIVGGTGLGSDTAHDISAGTGDLYSIYGNISGLINTICYSMVYYISPASYSGVRLNLYVDDLDEPADYETITSPIPDNANNWIWYPNPYINYIKLETSN